MSGKGWDKDLRMEREMKTGRAPELLGRGAGVEKATMEHQASWENWRLTTYRETLSIGVPGDSGLLQGRVQPVHP